MLPPEYLDNLPSPRLRALLAQAESDTLADMARRLTTYDYYIPAAQWQRKKLQELGLLHDEITKRLSKLTKLSEKEIDQMLVDAGGEALKNDDAIYRKAGLDPPLITVSETLRKVLNSCAKQTRGTFRNIMATTAKTATGQFETALDRAWMQISTGAFDRNTAIRFAIKDLSRQGVGAIRYPTGHIDTLEVATRRAIVTGAGQTAAKLQLARAEEMGCDLVEVSAHGGARPEHAAWQGKIYSLSGNSEKYPPFSETGYGTGAGLCGWNCRHSFSPYFDGMPRTYTPEMLADLERKKFTYNGQAMTEAEARGQQRYIERQIRRWKRENVAMNAAGQDMGESAAKIAHWQRVQADFLGQTGLKRQTDREQIAGWGKKQAQQVVQTNKKAVADYAAKHAAAALHKSPESSIINTEVWKFTDRKKADTAFRPLTETVWPKLTASERQAAFRYTEGSGVFNRPLRGYDGSWDRFVGVGKVPLDNEGAGTMIRDLQGAVAKVDLPADTWLFRGSDQQSLAGLLGIDKSKIIPSNIDVLDRKFQGETVRDRAFFSTGVSADAGFSDKIAYEVFAPKGTHGLYAEPFSRYGATNNTGDWDGKETSAAVGSEAEMILPAGTKFKVLKIKVVDGKLTAVLEVLLK